MGEDFVPLSRLAENPYAQLLCYPRPTPGEAESRMMELDTLGVSGLVIRGGKNVGGLKVLGKGCMGIVVEGRKGREKVAVKIRRVDANRLDMSLEAEMLRRANNLGVGPRLIAHTRNFLVMEYVEGPYLDAWAAYRRRLASIKDVLRNLLKQCHTLDVAGLDHGELSNASKHVVVTKRGRPVILDFESASVGRRASNLTSLVQYIYFRANSPFPKILGEPPRRELIQALNQYKLDKKMFQTILKLTGLEGEKPKPG
ncbi:MAG: RIO1 family regulatory kinase/ATPase [Candidatus Bathyarchaeia archaeon]